MDGFYCIEDDSMISKVWNTDELDAEILNYQDNEDYMAPNIYINTKPYPDLKLEKRCEAIAKDAVAKLFPEEKIVGSSFNKNSSASKQYYINGLDTAKSILT